MYKVYRISIYEESMYLTEHGRRSFISLKTDNANGLTDLENLSIAGFNKYITENIKIEKSQMVPITSFSLTSSKKK